MKQVLMMSKNDYFMADRETVIKGLKTRQYRISMFNALYKEQGRPSNEPVTDKELWDNRTYSELIYSDRIWRIQAQRRKSPRRWVTGGKEKKDVLSEARAFSRMDGVHVESDGVMYKISSGDAEALVLNYVKFEDIEKVLSSTDDNYLKI